MATIVQPYNPWREQLAFNALGNIAGNILGDIWARHKQSEENKKINAFRGQLQQDLQNNAGNNVSLTQPTPPDGYNSNPWGNALHQKYSPLTQFDIGTGGIGKVPSIQDIAQGVDRLAATPRFSMLGQEAVGKVRNDFMQRAYADMFANAPDRAGQYNAITQAVLGGNAPWQAMNSLGSVYMHETPDKQLVQTDLGTTKRVDSFDPRTGVITPGASFNVGINPTQQYVADSSANASRDVANIHALASTSNARTAADAQRLNYQIEYGQKYYDSLQEKYNQALQNMPSDEAAARVYQETILNPLRAQLDDAEANLRNLLQGAGNGQQGTQGAGQTTQTAGNGKSNSVWFSMVGNVQGISIHKNGYFGADRGDHTHKGIDLTNIPEGTDIRLPQEIGDEFIVRQAYKSKSYGNNIVLESNRTFNGKKIQFRIAHMQDGSLTLKPGQTIKAGDIIGKVGSTGRSTGPHIHLEVLYDGHLIDPSSFFETYSMDNPQPPTRANTPPAQPTPEQNTQQTQQTQTGDAPYLVSPDGTTMSLSEFDEIRDRGHYSANDLFEELSNKGWTLYNSPNLSALGYQQSNGNPPAHAEQSSSAITETTLPNRAFSLPGRPNFHKGWSLRDTINWINSIPPSNENPYWVHNQTSDNSNTTSVTPNHVSSGANPWGYIHTPNPSSIDIHSPILPGGKSVQPLPSQGNVSGDTRFNPIFTGNAADNFMQGFSALGLTQGDDTAVIPRTFFEENINPTPNDPRYSANVSVSIPSGEGYNPQPAPFPNNYMDRNRRNLNPYLNTGYSRGGVQSAWSLADFLNRFRNSENPLGRNFQALGSDPRNPPHYYLPGNVWQGLTPNPFSELIDGEYIFLDPNMYWR